MLIAFHKNDCGDPAEFHTGRGGGGGGELGFHLQGPVPLSSSLSKSQCKRLREIIRVEKYMII